MTGLEFKRQTYLIDEVSYIIDSLKDNNQYDADDGAAALGINAATWPLFGQVWPTSVAMAMNIYKLELAGKRVLEIGCGIGLCSIVLHQMGIDITASDYHPRVREFLERNVLGNGLPPIKYQTGNWDEENPELGKFDVMIGSDILYQPDHARLVSRFIDRHSSDDVQVVIGDPGRANRAKFTSRMIGLGYRHRFEKLDQLLQDGNCFKGRISHYRRHDRS
jgi:predicted nicotinamide N-methyase